MCLNYVGKLSRHRVIVKYMKRLTLEKNHVNVSSGAKLLSGTVFKNMKGHKLDPVYENNIGKPAAHKRVVKA